MYHWLEHIHDINIFGSILALHRFHIAIGVGSYMKGSILGVFGRFHLNKIWITNWSLVYHLFHLHLPHFHIWIATCGDRLVWEEGFGKTIQCMNRFCIVVEWETPLASFNLLCHFLCHPHTLSSLSNINENIRNTIYATNRNDGRLMRHQSQVCTSWYQFADTTTDWPILCRPYLYNGKKCKASIMNDNFFNFLVHSCWKSTHHMVFCFYHFKMSLLPSHMCTCVYQWMAVTLISVWKHKYWKQKIIDLRKKVCLTMSHHIDQKIWLRV